MSIKSSVMDILLNTILKIVSLFRRIFWKILKPKTFGIRVIILKDNNVLLVKHRYDGFWYLPGGKIKKNESEESAAKREIFEECKISIDSFERVLGRYKNLQEGKVDDIVILVAKEWKTGETRQGVEIEQVQFFNLDNLPENVSPATLRRIKEFLIQKQEEYFGSW